MTPRKARPFFGRLRGIAKCARRQLRKSIWKRESVRHYPDHPSGIGAASAILVRTARLGDVCVNYSRDKPAAEKIAAACREHGADVLVERADVSDDAQCRQFAERVTSRFGRCDALVNNAGTTKFVDLE